MPLLICFLLAPESPYYLVRKARFEDARNTLRRIRNRDTTDLEIDQTIALIDYTNKMEIEVSEASSYAECFRGKNRWRLEIVSCKFQRTLKQPGLYCPNRQHLGRQWYQHADCSVP